MARRPRAAAARSGPGGAEHANAGRLQAMNTHNPPARPRTYAVRTLGCQMNEHDSERMAGLLEQAGLLPVDQVP